jgi:hypothetical protein
MPTREQLNRMALQVRGELREKIHNMTREEKFAELMEFARLGGSYNIDLDEIKRDQKMLGLGDAELEQAVLICCALAGRMLMTLPMPTGDVKDAFLASDWAKWVHGKFKMGLRGAEPAFSLRKGGRNRLQMAIERGADARRIEAAATLMQQAREELHSHKPEHEQPTRAEEK